MREDIGVAEGVRCSVRVVWGGGGETVLRGSSGNEKAKVNFELINARSFYPEHPSIAARSALAVRSQCARSALTVRPQCARSALSSLCPAVPSLASQCLF